MPTTIASVMAYTASGQAAQDVIARENGALAGDGADEILSFGKFVGLDRRPHLGIERASLVVPVEIEKRRKEVGFWGLRKRRSGFKMLK